MTPPSHKIEDRGLRIEDRGSKVENPGWLGMEIGETKIPFSILDLRSSLEGGRRWSMITTKPMGDGRPS
jgi:hypothetical protein